MMRKSILIFSSILLSITGFAQQGAVISTNPLATLEPSAILEVQGTDGGMLIPRITKAQRSTLTASAAEGLWVYQTDGHPGLYAYNGSTWTRMSKSQSVHGKISSNTTSGAETLIGGTPGSYTVTQDASDFGVYDVTYTPGTFTETPTVIVTSNTLAPTSVIASPYQYCETIHLNMCTTQVAADYLDDATIEVCLTGSTASCSISPNGFADLDTGCNGDPNNFVDEFNNPAKQATLYGQTLYPAARYRIRVQSSVEWDDEIFSYIDWNQDADFTDPGEVIDQVFNPDPNDDIVTSPLLQVPATAGDGVTVLRVMSMFAAAAPNPCGTFSWGETHNYRVNIVGADPLFTKDWRPSNCSVTNSTSSGFRVFCTDLGEIRTGTTFHFYATEN